MFCFLNNFAVGFESINLTIEYLYLLTNKYLLIDPSYVVIILLIFPQPW